MQALGSTIMRAEKAIPVIADTELDADIDLFVSLYDVEDQASIELEAELLLALGKRGWALVFDLYPVIDDVPAPDE